MCSSHIPDIEWFLLPMRPWFWELFCLYCYEQAMCAWKFWLSFFWPMCTVIACLAKEQLEFSLWMWPFFPLSAIVLQIWGRPSTTLFGGIGYVLDVIWYTMLSPLASKRWKITRTIQSKLRRESANKCLASEKHELLVPNALNFFVVTEEDLKFGIRYLKWLLHGERLFVSHVKRSYKSLRRSRPLQMQ